MLTVVLISINANELNVTEVESLNKTSNSCLMAYVNAAKLLTETEDILVQKLEPVKAAIQTHNVCLLQLSKQ